MQDRNARRTQAGKMKLSDWMAKHKINDGVLAEALGVDRVTINRLRRNENMPSWSLMASLAKHTKRKVMPNDFLDAYYTFR